MKTILRILFVIFSMAIVQRGGAQPSTNGLILWLDSTVRGSVQTNSSGTVSAWLNLAPGASNGVQYTSNNDNDTDFNTDAPVYGPTANSGGRNVISFDGLGYLDSLGFSSETPLDLTIFVVASAATNRGDYSAFMAFDQSLSANDYQTGLNFDQGQNPSSTLNRLNLEGAKGGGNGGFQLLQSTELNFGQFYAYEIDYGGGPADGDQVFSVSVNGILVGSQSGSANTVSLNNLYIGARCFVNGFTPGSNNDMIGQIAAVLVYGHQLSGSDLTQTHRYIAGIVPPTVSLVTNTNKTLTVGWSSVVDATYQLQTTTNLLAAWQNVGASVTATNSLTTTSITIGADPQRFFRLALAP